MEIQVASIKAFFRMLSRQEGKVAVVFSTQRNIDTDALGTIPFLLVECADLGPGREGSFTPQMAEYIRLFLEQLKGVETVIFCCDEGQSRSTSLAAAYTRYLGNTDWPYWRNPYFHPNAWVYAVQCEAFGIHVSKLEARMRRLVNAYVLKRAVCKSRFGR